MAAKHTAWPGTFASAQHFLDALARDSRGLLSYIDAEERVMFGTTALADWFGLTPETIRGKTLRELHGDEALQPAGDSELDGGGDNDYDGLYDDEAESASQR